jgi:hypothetical protein
MHLGYQDFTAERNKGQRTMTDRQKLLTALIRDTAPSGSGLSVLEVVAILEKAGAKDRVATTDTSMLASA